MANNFAARSAETPRQDSRAMSPAVAISNHMVRLLAHYVGRGPTKARTTLGSNLVVVTLGDILTRAERNLLEFGEADTVVSTRRAFHGAMREEAVSAVQDIVERRVIGYMADVDTEANMAMIAFVLEAEPDPPISLDGSDG